ncbi:multidrug resistance protein B [Hydrogenophaga crassostreae]|uniref:MFS transporter n=1 Tax=Hydrogenophaga crassostreae TaxID=1763535 RepID=A0A162VU30_9BURK|nr:DHA2 family efflux MFS transporter permease subunit [Hydrogenophaga crassostreae]AOW12475.1 MFS transporter [Hydrogenophaga crassostreae]OAD40339.1 multidrug resistance protein B [Hydrogenophaga crassostreae]
MSTSVATLSGSADREPAPAVEPPAPHSPPVFAPLQGGQLVLGTIALSLATFMNVLDTSIANVSIPAIAGDMGVSPTQGTWVITSFAVANAISVPLTGWLTRRFGQVRLFTMSVLLFVLASWLCGLAPNIGTLIAFRVLQGLVAGPMIPLSQTLLLASYPRAKAGTAMAMWAMTVLVAPVAGPLLGGWITDNISWPWIFYINIPVGLFAAALTWSIYRSRDPGPRRVPLDVVGLFLLVIFVGAMQIMIDLGKELDWFESAEIIALAVTAVVSFLFFLAWELTDQHPIVDLRLFASRNFLSGTLALSIAYGLFFGNVVLLPLWLQQFMGYTATWAGLATAPVGLLAIVLSPWVGKNVSRIDPRMLATVAFLGFGGVLWMRSHFSTQADFETILIPTLIQGAAMAFFFIPLQAIVFSGLPPERMPSAAGLSNFVRITAGAVGTSLFTTLWANRAAMHHAQLSEAINDGSATAVGTIGEMMASGMTREQALATIDRLVNQQAFTLAVTDVFYLSAVLFIALVALVWVARPALGESAAGGGAH